MENTNQSPAEKGFFEKNKNFLVLLLLLVVVIGLSVTILLTQISSNYAQPASVANTQTVVKNTKTTPTDVLSQAIKDGKATTYPITTTLEKQLSDTFSGYVKSITGTVPPPGLFIYFCRPAGGGQGVLIGTQVNMGSTYSNEQYQCVFVSID
jgi:hypothetical protein